jgi:hypothetical protein
MARELRLNRFRLPIVSTIGEPSVVCIHWKVASDEAEPGVGMNFVDRV